jgi:hypothetical protein
MRLAKNMHKYSTTYNLIRIIQQRQKADNGIQTYILNKFQAHSRINGINLLKNHTYFLETKRKHEKI